MKSPHVFAIVQIRCKPPVNSVSSGIVKIYIFAGAKIVFGNSPKHTEYSQGKRTKKIPL
jgi:hypothetical protein